MPSVIRRDFAAPHWEAGGNDATKFEGFNQFVQVARKRVVVVAAPRLARTAEAPAVIRDHAITIRCQKMHLVFPPGGVERPGMNQDDGLTGAPIVVIELGAVGSSERCHEFYLLNDACRAVLAVCAGRARTRSNCNPARPRNRLHRL